MIEKKKVEDYLMQKRSLVLSELEREPESQKKIALHAMLGVIDSFLEDLENGFFDSGN